jgi:hypothetical protein
LRLYINERGMSRRFRVNSLGSYSVKAGSHISLISYVLVQDTKTTMLRIPQNRP